jgi:hypothetical protein
MLVFKNFKFFVTGMYFGLLLLGVAWLVLVSPSLFLFLPPPYPFPRVISVVACFETPRLSDAALSTWQGTDQPHVCPSSGGPATK